MCATSQSSGTKSVLGKKNPAHHFLGCVISCCVLELFSNWEGEYHLLLQFASVHFFNLSYNLLCGHWKLRVASVLDFLSSCSLKQAPKNVIFALHPILPNLCRDDKSPLWALHLLLFCIFLHFSSCRLCVALCHALSNHFYPTSTPALSLPIMSDLDVKMIPSLHCFHSFSVTILWLHYVVKFTHLIS